MYPLFNHRTRAEQEVWKRIKLTVWAYAYEIENDPIVSDDEFDNMAKSIDLSINTNRPDLDEWWRREFQPYTGQWIHNHPEKNLARRIYDRFR